MAKTPSTPTKTPRPRKPFPVIDPASLVDLPATASLNEFQASCYLGMSVHTLRQWRFRGVGPAYAKLGSAVRYQRGALDAYLEQASIRPQA